MLSQRKWLHALQRWFEPVNVCRPLRAQGAVDSVASLALTLLFLCELGRPGTLTSRDALRLMAAPELRQYLAFYLWHAFLYLVQMTASLLLCMDVRQAQDVKWSADGRRRTLLAVLVLAPSLSANLALSAAGALYFPWPPLGLLCTLHALSLGPYWFNALRHYRWLGDAELVHFETPLVLFALRPGLPSGTFEVGVEAATVFCERDAE